MQKFTVLTGVAAPLPMVNVDTDRIIPARFLKTIKRTGLGKSLFNDIRYEPDKAQILIAGENFGCGSSREHAPWALSDFGIRCVIAPSFADIFFNNCFKNGVLPVRLPHAVVNQLMEDAKRGANATFTIDLDKQVIVRPDGQTVAFDVEPFRKHCLLNGLDDIGLTLEKRSSIDSFEGKQRTGQPWLYAGAKA